MTRTASFFALLMVTGCYASRAPAPDLVDCEPADCTLFRADQPEPRGRIDACDTCAATEAEVQARQVELGCRLTAAHAACTLDGACSYAVVVERWAAIRSAQSCEALAGLAQLDPCVRPDPRHYWRPGGGCG